MRSHQTAWIGDKAAFEAFQHHASEMPPLQSSDPLSGRLLMGATLGYAFMQLVLSGDAATVGAARVPLTVLRTVTLI